jgi:CSLREA domain-containing protein
MPLRKSVFWILALTLVLPLSGGVQAMGTPLIAAPAIADWITVNTTLDENTPGDGTCSLREAIQAFNLQSAYHECQPAASETLIRLPAGTYNLSLGQLTVNPAVNAVLTIQGAGSSASILNANSNHRVLAFSPAAGVALRGILQGISLRGGLPAGGSFGGGLQVGRGASVDVTDSLIQSNANAGAYNLGTLTVTDSSVTGNAGGGLINDGGTLYINSTLVTFNTGNYGVLNANVGATTYLLNGSVAQNSAGGVFSNNGMLSLNGTAVFANGGPGIQNLAPSELWTARTTIYGNSASNGAGLLNSGARATIVSTRIYQNAASGAGGGISNTGSLMILESTMDGNTAINGGGIAHTGGSLTAVNSTIAGNSASVAGGGMYSNAAAELLNTTIAANTASQGAAFYTSAGSLSARNTIFAAANNALVCKINAPGQLISTGRNIDSGASCGLASPQDDPNTNPRLSPLAYLDGLTPMMAPSPFSPAINRGSNRCPIYDQRHAGRPQQGTCDIGAFEWLAYSHFGYLPMTRR